MISTYGQVPYGTSAPAAPNYAIAGPSASAYSFSLPGTATSDSGHLTSGMTTILAEQAIARLISADLKEKGFDGAEPQALKRLEEEVVSFFQEIYRRAQDYGNLANRAFPAVADLHQAAVEMGLGPAQLRSTTRKRKRPRKYRLAFELAEPQTKPAPPQLLAYDQDDSLPAIPVTLRSLPNPYPHLPPSHTYLRTPPSPPRKQDGQTRDNKLKNAALVQESLRNILAQTEDVVDPEDTELLGAIVNWESNTLPRKKWKVHG